MYVYLYDHAIRFNLVACTAITCARSLFDSTSGAVGFVY